MEIVICIDDVHPEKGWGLKGDKCMEYLEKLNKEFGAKFVLFIPSNYHDKYPISDHQEWIDWLKSKDYFELAAHGHYHACERTDIGECEFFEIDTADKAKSRIWQMMDEWSDVGHKPTGWRNPGWLAHPEAAKWLGPIFDYSAVHYEHNNNIQWDCRTFYGADGIHETDISLHDGRIMFQSHIAGDWNDNVWNEENYEQLRMSLKFLTENNDTKFVTLEEINTRKKVIYITAVGNLPYMEHTYPLLEKYAAKVNADIRIFNDDDFAKTNYPSPNFLIFDIFNEFVDSKYEQMMYIDVDIRILDQATDIFKEVEKFGMVQDHKADMWRREAMQTWLDKHYAGMQINHYFNGGVIVSDKQSIKDILKTVPDDILSFWKSTKDTFNDGFNQNILNYCIIKSNIEYQELPDKWNKVCRKAGEEDYFIHYVANKTQIQTGYDKFKDNKCNPDITMTLDTLRYV